MLPVRYFKYLYLETDYHTEDFCLNSFYHVAHSSRKTVLHRSLMREHKAQALAQSAARCTLSSATSKSCKVGYYREVPGWANKLRLSEVPTGETC